jgi:hypothetical protein
MIKKLIGYISGWFNEIAFECGYLVGYDEGFEQGVKDTLVAHGLEEEE